LAKNYKYTDYKDTLAHIIQYISVRATITVTVHAYNKHPTEPSMPVPIKKLKQATSYCVHWSHSLIFTHSLTIYHPSSLYGIYLFCSLCT